MLVTENAEDSAERALEAEVRAALFSGPPELPVRDVRFETLGAASRAALKAGGWSRPLTQRRGVSARRELRDHLLQEGIAAVIFQVEGDEEAFRRLVVEPIRRDLGALRGVADRLVRWPAEGAGARLRAVPAVRVALGWEP
ncbi:hypothetical protein LBMAG42_35320 [Deltaproteobacteria bacterium]|nr:hypothetical protein LBMAG42_35320 [Deltaproteobacteria bacterium]